VRDGRHGHARYPSNILDRRHAFRPPAQNTFAFIIQIPFSIVNKICANAGFGTPEQAAGTGKNCVTLPVPAFVFPYAAFRVFSTIMIFVFFSYRFQAVLSAQNHSCIKVF